MLKVGLHANDASETDSDDALRFLNSVKELKDLRSQIHDAATYCEKTFLNSEKKADVLDNTKEYLCRAVVTVVDHLGSVSANLNRRIQNTDRHAETHIRINCLKQKLDSCDQYNRNFTLPKTRWSTNLPQHHPHYISTPSDSSGRELSIQLRGSDNQPTEVMEARIIMPVNDGMSIAPKLIRNPSFHFQETRKAGGIRKLLKTMNEKEIISFIRRSKWEPSRFLKLKP